MEVAASGSDRVCFYCNLVATTEVAGDGPGPHAISGTELRGAENVKFSL